MFYNQAKKEAIKRLEGVEKEYNSIGQKGNDLAMDLYSSRKSAAKAIDRIESYINTLANSPKEFSKEIAEIKLAEGETLNQLAEAKTDEEIFDIVNTVLCPTLSKL